MSWILGLLIILWIWDIYEKALLLYLERRYKPVSLPEKPVHTTSDVSIVVPTIDTAESFSECLRLWIASKPLEIIIVTIDRNLALVQRMVSPFLETFNRIKVLTVTEPSKRRQINRGVEEATGEIVALVDDDAYWEKESTLNFLIAPFGDSQVGAVGGAQSGEIPVASRNPKNITIWEVAALRQISIQNPAQAARYTADRGVFVLIGRTMLVRTSILKDAAFSHAFANEYWGGNLMNTGDDNFICEWVHWRGGFDLCIQNAPEAEITTHVWPNSNFFWQLVRWQKSSIQSYRRKLLESPGIVTMWTKHPYTTRKMVERLFRPVYLWLYLLTWMSTMWINSVLGSIFLMYFACGWYYAYREFLRKYPYCRGKIWAAWLMDYCYLVVDVYAWVTLNQESWMTRDDQPQAQQKIN